MSSVSVPSWSACVLKIVGGGFFGDRVLPMFSTQGPGQDYRIFRESKHRRIFERPTENPDSGALRVSKREIVTDAGRRQLEQCAGDDRRLMRLAIQPELTRKCRR